MNKVEVGQLLTIASGFDRFVTVDRVTTEAWFLALRDVPYADAQRVVVEHYTGPRGREKFTVRDVLEAVESSARLSVEVIEADVRSAKARGIVDQSWPKREPLTVEDATKLSLARQRDIAESKAVAELAGGLS